MRCFTGQHFLEQGEAKTRGYDVLDGYYLPTALQVGRVQALVLMLLERKYRHLRLGFRKNSRLKKQTLKPISSPKYDYRA
jgi:hypothetical protein